MNRMLSVEPREPVNRRQTRLVRIVDMMKVKTNSSVDSLLNCVMLCVTLIE